ncbi:MAG: alpha-ribazole phosphatase CobZ [Euryarchaeota archaeon]|nr:alpha-ribazole phosphatase CobZ [Euryarchaeota archaeon]
MGVSCAHVLERLGVTRASLVSTCLELFVPHPGVETRERAAEVLERIFDLLLEDVNVCALLEAALALEEKAARGELHGVSAEDHSGDAVFIVADEIIGMAIAEYIAGTRARFEFVRYDMQKPGVLSSLPPFADDAVAGLIAGASALMYSMGELI